MDVWYRGQVKNPQNGQVSAGFAISGNVKRSDYNLGPNFPEAVLSDNVLLDIDTEFKNNKILMRKQSPKAYEVLDLPTCFLPL